MKNTKTTKILFSCFFLFALITVAKGQSTDTKAKDTIPGPEIYFDNMAHDFDTIIKGSGARCEFTFKNTGNEPLILEKVKTSCECTASKWSKKPILPGKTGVIKVIYSTRSVGYFYRTIAVISNAKTNPVELYIQGTVIK
jgi:Rps23 Pro-64 3,4-dihydroxylase Tpa1-like proline 4-hydroxylase